MFPTMLNVHYDEYFIIVFPRDNSDQFVAHKGFHLSEVLEKLFQLERATPEYTFRIYKSELRKETVHLLIQKPL